jgi:hypothetical protein
MRDRNSRSWIYMARVQFSLTVANLRFVYIYWDECHEDRLNYLRPRIINRPALKQLCHRDQ